MPEQEKLDSERIENSIIRGSRYLLSSLLPDGGIKYEDEKSTRSGVWVTAEALEFFLSSRALPIITYTQVKPMLDYLLKQQREDGSWTILSLNDEDESSTISTGHCLYVLKMAISENFLDSKTQEKISRAIQSGEGWLSQCIVEMDGYAFFKNKISDKNFNPNIDESSRIEFIFISYYALMGIISPNKFEGSKSVIQNYKKKFERYFRQQVDWLTSNYDADKVNKEELPNITSTFCRLINISSLLNSEEIFTEDSKHSIEKILSICADNPFATTRILIENSKNSDTGATYTNNTPFDFGIALLNLNANIEITKEIINKYIEMQNIEGFWFLGFGKSFKIKTWTTSEALLVLERALHDYSQLELSERYKIVSQKEEELQGIKKSLNAENKRLWLRIIILTGLITSILFFCGIVLAIWDNSPAIRDSALASVAGQMVLPLIIAGIVALISFIRSLLKRVRLNKL